jgi:hypothetical protein
MPLAFEGGPCDTSDQTEFRPPPHLLATNMRPSHWISFTFALVGVLTAATQAHSEVYRWKDSQGKVHFSDQPISTDPGVVREVVVPSPNVANAFKPRPNNAARTAEVPVDAGVSSDSGDSAKPQDALRPRGVAANSQESCRQKRAAYEASRACFDACGSNNGTDLWGGRNSGRNNAGCEHCGEQPMPHC